MLGGVAEVTVLKGAGSHAGESWRSSHEEGPVPLLLCISWVAHVPSAICSGHSRLMQREMTGTFHKSGCFLQISWTFMLPTHTRCMIKGSDGTWCTRIQYVTTVVTNPSPECSWSSYEGHEDIRVSSRSLTSGNAFPSSEYSFHPHGLSCPMCFKLFCHCSRT